ncbi:MAG: hypothetical protein R3A44_38080 [Caldilineaceae bacterium]
MTKIIWLNQPTNHSGAVNFLFLTPDQEIGHLTIYMADPIGPYILGGPALGHYFGGLSEAALTLLSFLPAGFHFFPAKETDIRKTVNEAWDQTTDGSSGTLQEKLADWDIHVYAKHYDVVQCCEMLRNNSTPDAPIVFVDWQADGNLLLGVELARIYYNMSKEQREELGLKQDWRHYLEA